MEYLSDFDNLHFNEEDDIKRSSKPESIDFSQSDTKKLKKNHTLYSILMVL